MKRFALGMCMMLLLVQAALPATAIWNDQGDHQWSTTSNWSTSALPVAGDTVQVNGVAVIVEVADVVAPESGSLANLVLANNESDIVNMTVKDGASLTAAKATIGNNGTVHLVITNATVTYTGGNAADLSVANSVTSTGTITVLKSGVYVGTQAAPSNIGIDGVGTVYVNGGSFTSLRAITLGAKASGIGSAYLNGGKFSSGGYYLYIGGSGKGHLEFQAQTELGFSSLTIGRYATGDGVLDLGEYVMTVGATQGMRVGEAGTGVLKIRGGSISSSSGSGFYVRDLGGTGLVQGWGRIADFRNIRNNGLIIADGEGVDRQLYMNINRNDGYVTNTIDNEPKGTNGWFAVNKGMLTLELRKSAQLGVNPAAFNWGETETDEDIDLVNSLRVSFQGASAGNFSASLLAPDRDDVAANSPLPPLSVVGLWNVSFSANFGSVDFECRYDHTRLPKGHQALLMRWDPGASEWVRLPTYETGTADAPYRVKTDGLTPQAGTQRIGLIGAFAVPRGTLIFMR